MEKRLITVSLSTQRVTFQPGGQPASFEVNVRNDSDQQAQFQLEVLAPGATRGAGDWYRLSPEVSVAKPAGDETAFQVYIVDAPFPNFVGIVNLTVKVVSPQLPGETRRVIALTVEPGVANAALSVMLTPQRVQAYPRNVVDLTAHVRNLTQQPIDALLRLSGISASWMLNGTERRILLNPRTDEYVTFQCQPPTVSQALSQAYPFQVEASSQGSAIVRTEGILDILPIGFIKFAVAPEQQAIPAAHSVNPAAQPLPKFAARLAAYLSIKRWLPDFKTRSATVYAAFENVSNLIQQVNLVVQGKDCNRCRYEPPMDASLGLGETVKLPLEIGVTRPWIGWIRTLNLDIYPQLRGAQAVDVEPPFQAIKLRVLPLIPLWLVLALLALLLALLFLLLRPEPIGHTNFVNAVRFSSDALSVVSGSDDCTIRRWLVSENQLQPEGRLTGEPAQTSCAVKPLKPEGVLAFTRAVESLEFLPKDNDRVAAGLDNGAVQLWHLPTRQLAQVTLRDSSDPTDDRVFALAFTEDSRTLFSGHGSGKIRVWQRPTGGNFDSKPLPPLSLPPDQNYQVRTLAISPDGSLLVSAGSSNTLALWNPSNLQQPARLIMPQGGDNDYIWDATFAPNSHLLATAHSNGEIKLWDLDRCAKGQELILNCTAQDQWQAAQKAGNVAIRSVRFSPDGKRLVSASDDGKVRLWTLASPSSPGQLLYTSSAKVNAVDLVAADRNLLIVSGGDDHRVVLRRVE